MKSENVRAIIESLCDNGRHKRSVGICGAAVDLPSPSGLAEKKKQKKKMIRNVPDTQYLCHNDSTSTYNRSLCHFSYPMN